MTLMKRWLVVLAALTLLAACDEETEPTDGGSGGTDAGMMGTDAGMMGTDAGMMGTDAGMMGTDAGDPDAGAPAVTYTLQILHTGDPESGVEAVEDAPRFSAVLEALAPDYENTVILSSGDNWIPGPFYASGGDGSLESVDTVEIPASGRPDIAMLNAMGFQATVFGNHEFDQGTDAVFDILGDDDDDVDEDGTPDLIWPGTQFPYLSANIDFSGDGLSTFVVEDGNAPMPSSIAGSVVLTVGGEQIGIVGATTPTLPAISSPGDGIVVSPEIGATPAQIAAEIQPTIDALDAAGVDKIIVLAHMQTLSVERGMATALRNVDVIIAGGSNSILADDDDRLRAGDTAVDTYPILSSDADGEPIAIINTDGNWRYVGRLVVGFDAAGHLVPSSIDPSESGAYATDAMGVTDVGGTPNATVADIAAAVGAVISAKDGNLFGATDVFLEARRAIVRTEETNLGNLSADSIVWLLDQLYSDGMPHVSVKNAGGIRAPIGVVSTPPGSTMGEILSPPPANADAGKMEGDVSQLDLENAMRFNNRIGIVEITYQQLVNVLEHAVCDWDGVDPSGRFPQVAGLRFSVDPTQTGLCYDGLSMTDALALNGPSRVRDLVIETEGGDIRVLTDGAFTATATDMVRVGSLTFITEPTFAPLGGDSYPFPLYSTTVRATDVTVPTGFPDASTFSAFGREQDVLAEYLAMFYPRGSGYDVAETERAMDERIQFLADGRTFTP